MQLCYNQSLGFFNCVTNILQCNRTVALDGFFKQIIQDPVKISWIGSGCSVATEPTAELSHYYNVTQVISFHNVLTVN